MGYMSFKYCANLCFQTFDKTLSFLTAYILGFVNSACITYCINKKKNYTYNYNLLYTVCVSQRETL